ncbi:MAG: biotin/lipoate A/B protein ligase family protein [Eubacteriales bacterium]
MLSIKNDSHDPAFCLAAEEFLLENYTQGEFLMLWSGDKSVITGKFQNIYEEVSLLECQKNNIGIFRRNSGGGTVYHDLGNVNFSFFADKGENSPDYERFLTPIVHALCSIGIPAELGKSFDITVGGKKVSGNAQSVHKSRVMHHGTLLFDTDLGVLSSVTGHASAKITSKAIKSTPAPVCNMKPFAPELTTETFAEEIKNALCSDEISFTDEETAAINRIADEKYRTWEWNFGRSPAFDLKSSSISLSAKNGVILSSDIYSETLVGLRLIPDVIYDALRKSESEAEAEKIVREIFN